MTTGHVLRAIVICAISLAMHAHARADTPVNAATDCGQASTTGVAESPQCAESTAVDEHPPDLHSDPPRSRWSRWYGWQTLLADGLSLGIAALGFENDLSAVGTIGLAGLLLATPIVHFAHGNVLGVLSLGLRLASAAVVLVGFAEALGSESDDGESNQGSASNFYFGIVMCGITSLLDAAVLAVEPSSTVVAPYVDARGGVGLKLAWRL